MTQVRFKLEGDASPERDYPLRILDRELVLVAETRTAGETDLPAGQYIAQSVLPDGQPLQTAFEVQENEGASKAVILKAGTARGRPEPRRGASFMAPKTTSDFVAQRFRQMLEVVGVDARGAKLQVVDARSSAPTHLPHRITVHGADAYVTPGPPLSLRYIRPGLPVWNVRLPLSRTEGVIIDLRKHDGEWLPHIRLEDPRFELLLQYASSEQPAELARLAGDIEDAGEEAIDGKLERPMMGALGFYALLKIGAFRTLNRASARLNSRNPDLADTYVIRGECLARMGEHMAAVQMFSSLASAGLPVFTTGLRFSSERLSMYRSVQDLPELLGGDAQGADLALKTLMQTASALDATRPLVTFYTDIAGTPGKRSVESSEFRRADGVSLTLGR